MQIPKSPKIYEINTAVWLRNLSEKYSREIRLDGVPDNEWYRLAGLDIDAVWLMGVWQRSVLGHKIALGNSREYRKLVPDLVDEDVIGSAYSIYRYEVADSFGGTGGLAKARRKLKDLGIGLILDFVPNHVALDHHWTHENIEHFVKGNEHDLKQHPKAFYKTPVGIVARGKDPYFEPWSDVAQLNAFSAHNRRAAIRTLKEIANQCDGVRCDMAMLMCNDIFASTWGERAGPMPPVEYWPEVIQAVRSDHPGFLLLAEVYWDRQDMLLEQGFDLCYDKDFYDKITTTYMPEVLHHLRKTEPIQKHLLRFLENHDEERVAGLLAPRQARAAAVLLATQPSAQLYFEGQLDGYKARIPVQLSRGPELDRMQGLELFYKQLLETATHIRGKHAAWSLVQCQNVRLGRASNRVMTSRWQSGSTVYITVINYSPKHASIRPPLPAISGWKELLGYGLTIKPRSLQLKPWGYAILKIA